MKSRVVRGLISRNLPSCLVPRISRIPRLISSLLSGDLPAVKTRLFLNSITALHVSIGFCAGRGVSKGLFRLSNQLCDELRSVGSHAVPCKNDVRPPREQFVADDLNDRARLLRVAPAAVQNILVLETEV